MLSLIRKGGYELCTDSGSCDVVVINTCGFIDSAVQESLEAIGEALNENGKVIVTGCLGGKRRSDPRSPPESAGNYRAS